MIGGLLLPLLLATSLNTEEFEKDLSTLVALSSSSHDDEGLNQMASLLEARLKKLGMQTQWDFPTRSLKAWRPYLKESTSSVLFLAHFDTVFDREDDFKQVHRVDAKDHPARAFAPILSGPGVVDDKAGILLVEEILKKNPLMDIRVFLAADEEVGSKLSKLSLLDFAKGTKISLVFEPGWFDFELQQNRLAAYVGENRSVEVQVKGPGTQGSLTSTQGKSAADLLISFLESLTSLRNPNFFVNIFEMTTSSKPNVTAAEARAKVSLRFDGEKNAALLEAALKPWKENSSLEWKTKEVWKPLEISSDFSIQVLQAAAKEEGLSPFKPSISLFRSGGYFLAEAGFQVIDGLGCLGGDYHSEREWLALGSCDERLRLANAILRKVNEKK